MPKTDARIVALTDVAAKFLAKHEGDEDSRRRLLHAQRVIDIQAAPMAYPCASESQSGWQVGSARMAQRINTADLPEALGAPLSKTYTGPVAELTSERGYSEPLINATRLLRNYNRVDDAGKGRMMIQALERSGHARRVYSFMEGAGAQEQPARLVQDLNLAQRALHWFDLNAAEVVMGIGEQGHWITVAERPEWVEQGALAINLRLASFASLAHAIGAAHVLFSYAKAEGLTRAWISDL